MTWLEILILVLIAGYCAYIMFGKKKYSCCGDCSKCRQCVDRNDK